MVDRFTSCQQNHVAEGNHPLRFLQAEGPTQAGLLMKRRAHSAVCCPLEVFNSSRTGYRSRSNRLVINTNLQ